MSKTNTLIMELIKVMKKHIDTDTDATSTGTGTGTAVVPKEQNDEGALEQLLSLVDMLQNDRSPEPEPEPEPEPDEITHALYLSDLSDIKQKQLAALYQCSHSELTNNLLEPVGTLTII